ncbi:MAG: hypothetical protein WD969_16855 [Paracoccaceae bacterium]
MFPFRRQIPESLRGHRMASLAPGETHVHALRIMPCDIDPFGDFNNVGY